MLRHRTQGCVLGHLCGVVGATIAIDGIVEKFALHSVRIFPYGNVGFIIAALMLVLGARVVRENLPRKSRGPWQR
jgi:hypothetical protein